MAEDFLTLTIGKTKNIALIAHDNMKHTLIEWCNENKDIFNNMRNMPAAWFFVCAIVLRLE